MSKTNEQVVWITGASSGIGKALVHAYDQKNYKLIISARNENALEGVKGECQNPQNIKILPLDLADHNAMPETVTKALSFYKGIDILINNAGISQRSLILETGFEVFKKLMDVNYLGTIAMSNALLPSFVQRKGGHFVVVTSIMGKFGSPYRSGYCGAKHALHGYFDVLRMEHEKDGIKVTLACPGFVQTNLAKNALTADGTPQVKDDKATKNGLSPSIFAKRMINAIERNKFEVYIGRKEINGMYLKRFFPRLLHKIVLRSQVR